MLSSKGLIAFAGIQPSGLLHLGNYFGSIQWFVKNQCDPNFERLYLMIADLHALTLPSLTNIREKCITTTAEILACGIDPKKVIIFRQSKIPYHTNLMWLLMNQVSTEKLHSQIQWKEKSKILQNNSALFTYPVLQAADILLYGAQKVPVGPDQTQHLEFTSTLATKINNHFNKNIFTLPEAVIAGPKVKSITNPHKKMSKSDQCSNSCIYFVDDDLTVQKKILKAVTDSDADMAYDINLRPGLSSLLELFSYSSSITIEDLEQKYKNGGYSVLKKDLINSLINFIRPVRNAYEEMKKENFITVEQVLEESESNVRDNAFRNFLQIWNMMH